MYAIFKVNYVIFIWFYISVYIDHNFGYICECLQLWILTLDFLCQVECIF